MTKPMTQEELNEALLKLNKGNDKHCPWCEERWQSFLDAAQTKQKEGKERDRTR